MMTRETPAVITEKRRITEMTARKDPNTKTTHQETNEKDAEEKEVQILSTRMIKQLKTETTDFTTNSHQPLTKDMTLKTQKSTRRSAMKSTIIVNRTSNRWINRDQRARGMRDDPSMANARDRIQTAENDAATLGQTRRRSTVRIARDLAREALINLKIGNAT